MKRLLHERVKGPLANNEDWWYLVFDQETKRLFVQHEWSYVDLGRLHSENSGSKDLDVTTFLRESDSIPARTKLTELLESLFDADSGGAGR
jgi:hypothetical protein